MGSGHAYPGDHHFAVREARLHRSHVLRYDLDSEAHHAPFRSRAAARRPVQRRRSDRRVRFRRLAPHQDVANEASRPAWRSIPAGVWTLGLVSLLMDTSSELIHSLLPLFLVTTLGASTLAVGIIEGIAEATALITKVFSGYLSDYFRNRKVLTVLGYGLAAATKPMFPLASSLGWVVCARFVDRIGKGIRGAPRDALIADITPALARGVAYGLRQTLDTIGAVAGPALAIVAMLWFADNFRTVFWFAVVPAAASVALLIFGVREPERSADPRKRTPPISMADIKRL